MPDRSESTPLLTGRRNEIQSYSYTATVVSRDWSSTGSSSNNRSAAYETLNSRPAYYEYEGVPIFRTVAESESAGLLSGHNNNEHREHEYSEHREHGHSGHREHGHSGHREHGRNDNEYDDEDEDEDEIEAPVIDNGPGYAERFQNVSPTRFLFIFSGILVGYLVAFFDATLIASIHPVITSHFEASNAASWLSTAFLLTSTACVPLFGRASDTFGHKPVYLFSIAIFFATTAWSARAQTIGSMIAARTICGLGAGGVLSLGTMLARDLVVAEHRGAYQSYINLAQGVGGCLGLAFGGVLCDQIGWRTAFYIQLPAIFVHFFVTAWTLPADLGLKKNKKKRSRMTVRQQLQQHKIDMGSSTMLIVSVTALIVGLNCGGNVFPWSHPLVISSLVVGVALAGMFVWYECKCKQYPSAVVAMLSQQPHASLILGTFSASVSIHTVSFNAPLYFQAVKLVSPTQSGLKMLFALLAVTVSGASAGVYTTWSQRLKPTILVGELFLVVGGVACAFLDVDTPVLVAMVCVALSSVGQGAASDNLIVSVLATSDPDEQAAAAATLNRWQYMGSVMGVSVSSWIFQNCLVHQLRVLVSGPDKEGVIGLARRSVQAIGSLDALHKEQGESFVLAAWFTIQSSLVLTLQSWMRIVGVFGLRLLRQLCLG